MMRKFFEKDKIVTPFVISFVSDFFIENSVSGRSAFENKIILVQKNFFRNFDFKSGCKNEYEGKNKTYETDPEIELLEKLVIKPS